MLYLVLDDGSIHVDTCSEPKKSVQTVVSKKFVRGASLVLKCLAMGASADGVSLFDGVMWDIVFLFSPLSRGRGFIFKCKVLTPTQGASSRKFKFAALCSYPC